VPECGTFAIRYAHLKAPKESMVSKHDPRGKRSSSKPRPRREEQLDLFTHGLTLAPATSTLGGVQRARPNPTRGQRAAAGAPTRLVLL
jgi:hypothetical protein